LIAGAAAGYHLDFPGTGRHGTGRNEARSEETDRRERRTIETMPNTPSAIKRLKQSRKRRLHNRIAKKLIRTYSKRTFASVASKEFEKAESDFRLTTARIDKAGARRVLHPNTAARRKSRFAREYHAAVAKAKASA
jgi:small subunit ribosomal protein S20